MFNVEELHRWAFDTCYKRRYKITKDDEKKLEVYKKLKRETPDFREYLRLHLGGRFKRYKDYDNW